MPRVNWGVGKDTVDDYDRESGFKPYTGKIPPNAVYQWRIKVLKYAAGTKTKNPSLRAGLELVPRNAEEKQFAGYFLTKWMAIAETNSFQWVPFLDSIGVTGREFTAGTVVDDDGNVRKIGNWRMDGKTEILGQLKDGNDEKGNSRKEIGWVGALDGEAEEFEEEDAEEEEGYDEDDDGF